MATWRKVITAADDAAYKNEQLTLAQLSEAMDDEAGFGANKILKVNGGGTAIAFAADDDTPGGYNNSNWDTAYTHSQAAHAPSNADLTSENTAANASAYTGASIGVAYTDAKCTNALADQTSVNTCAGEHVSSITVRTAGALMDDELDSIADVKALNQSVRTGASPTFVTANMSDAANKRFMTDVQETKLDNIEVLADVTDADNVETAGALMEDALSGVDHVKSLDQDVTIGSSPTFAGLTVTGEAVFGSGVVTLDAEVQVKDEFILLNSDFTGIPDAEDVGIEVNRGDADNVRLFWDEGDEDWRVEASSGDSYKLATMGSGTSDNDFGNGSFYTADSALYVYL